jgi:hypothetical protein
MAEELSGEIVDDLEFEEEEEVEPEVSPDLVFTTEVKDRTGSDVGQELPFKVDEVTYTAVRPPDDAFVFLTTAAVRSTPMAERMAAIIQFLGEALVEESAVRLRDRLLDPKDDFSFTDLLPIMESLVKKWQKGRKPRPARARARGGRRR